MPSDEIMASEEIFRLVARLRRVLSSVPAVLPTSDSPVVRPLAIGAGEEIHKLVVPPEGMPPAKAHAIVADTLKTYVRSSEYRAALAMPEAMRHDLDGNPVEPVSPEHAQFARGIQSRSPITTKETIHMQVPALKVTLPLSPDQLRPIGETVKTVDIQLDLGDGRPFTVPFSGKNYRRALRQVDELRATGAEVVVVLQGRLISNHRIEQAGLSVQSKTPKLEN